MCYRKEWRGFLCLVTVYRWLQLSIKRQAISVGWYYLTPHRYNTHGHIFYSLVIVCDIFLFFSFFLFFLYNPRDREYLRIAFEISSWRACFDFFPFAFRGQRTWATRDKVNLDGKYTCFTRTPRTLSMFEKILRKICGIYHKKKEKGRTL